MPEIPPSIATIVAIVAALGGISGIAALINSLTAAKKVEFDALCQIVDQLRSENQRLLARIRDLEQQNKWLLRENNILRGALKRAGIDVPEFTVQSDD